MIESMTPTDDLLRAEAIERLKKKRDFHAHLLAYLMVNGFLIALWAMTGAHFFWPVFVLLCWGIGLVFHARDTYSLPPTEEQIRREVAAIRGARGAARR